MPQLQGKSEERARELLHLRGLVARALALPGLSQDERCLLSAAAEQAAAELKVIEADGVDLSALTGGAVLRDRPPPGGLGG